MAAGRQSAPPFLAAVYGPGRRLRQHPFQHPPIAPCVEDQRGAITPEFVADYGLRFHRTLTDAEAALDDGTCGACANCGPGSLIASEQVTVSAIRGGPGCLNTELASISGVLRV